MPGLSGPFAQVMEGAQELCRAVERLGGMEDWQRRRRWGTSPRAGQAAMAAALDQLQTLWQAPDGWTELQLDLSLTGDMEYYTGLVFQGYLAGLPRPVLKGGQYDLLAQKFCPGGPGHRLCAVSGRDGAAERPAAAGAAGQRQRHAERGPAQGPPGR